MDETLRVCIICPQEYNPPCSKDIPIDFRVELLKNAPNPLGVLGSKGELNLSSLHDIDD